MISFQHVMQTRFPDMQMDGSEGKLSWRRERGVGLSYKVKWLR